MKKFILAMMMILPMTSEAGPLSKLLGRSTAKETVGVNLSRGALNFGGQEGTASLYLNIIPGVGGTFITKKLTHLTDDELGYAVKNSISRLAYTSSSNREKITAFSIQNADGSRLEAVTSKYTDDMPSEFRKTANFVRVVELSLHGMDDALVNEAYSLAISRGVHAIPRDKKLYVEGKLYRVSTLSFYLHKSRYTQDELKVIGEVTEHINRRHLQTPAREAVKTVFSRKSVR